MLPPSQPPEDGRWYSTADFGRAFGYTAAAVRRMARLGLLRSRPADSGSEVSLPAGVSVPDCAADAVPRLSRSHVATLLGVTGRRVDQLVEEGRLARHQVGCRYRYSVNDVFAYLADRSNTRASGLRGQMLAWASRRLQAKIATAAPETPTARFQAEMDRIATMPAPRQPVEYARLLLRYERGRRHHLARTEKLERARAGTPPAGPETAPPPA